MPRLLDTPSQIPVPGGKLIDEYVGRVATGTEAVSVARMTAPPGWSEPAQRPEFDEITLVLTGEVVVEHDGGPTSVQAGQVPHPLPGVREQRLAGDEGASYVAICVPAFGPDLAGREEG
jgi:quercetin dioxygenase-like cupin family protein